MTTVYLAGKITKNGWREQFVKGLHNAYNDYQLQDEEPWPILRDALGDGLHYVGPFFTRCDHGCAHVDGNHGFAGGCIEYDKPHMEPYSTRREVASRCLRAIHLADVVIALITDDAHGTLVEVGYALGLGKRVIACDVIEQQTEPDAPAAWFPFFATDSWGSVAGAIADLAGPAKVDAELALCESPVEVQYLKAIRQHRVLDRFKPAVQVDGGRFRIDFADNCSQVGIEIDGHEWHSSKEQFVKDRARQRYLEQMGWRLLRFAGAEVFHDADKCALQTIDWLQANRP